MDIKKLLSSFVMYGVRQAGDQFALMAVRHDRGAVVIR
jgi:hypothetical protein